MATEVGILLTGKRGHGSLWTGLSGHPLLYSVGYALEVGVERKQRPPSRYLARGRRGSSLHLPVMPPICALLGVEVHISYPLAAPSLTHAYQQLPTLTPPPLPFLCPTPTGVRWYLLVFGSWCEVCHLICAEPCDGEACPAVHHAHKLPAPTARRHHKARLNH